MHLLSSTGEGASKSKLHRVAKLEQILTLFFDSDNLLRHLFCFGDY